ncbi:MAG: ABC transporter ATP-binding protein [Candidatus Thorarchaeota archaeon]|nr:ABC transporter ATP-binding protein [Candidatus Thorarchaeota archaeon]
MPVVEVQNYTKSFGSTVAVNNVSFEVREGEVYGILGPNGAGKTTTLKLLMGLLEPDSGTGKIFGMDCIEDPIEVKKLVGYVPEEHMLYDSLTPRELYEFIASIRDLPDIKTNNKIRKMVKALSLDKYFDQMILTLSQGNQQKVLLISALLHSPKLLILDEPFSGLDVKSVRIMKDIIAIHKENGGAVLLSTHIMEVAQGLCDRIGILNNGRLIAEGTLEQLRSQAEQEGATLEQLFLRLTNQEDDVAQGVDALREALSE